MAVKWEKRSARLYVGTSDDNRQFRAEKTGTSASFGTYAIKELDDLGRTVNEERLMGLIAAKRKVAEWLAKPRPTEPIRDRRNGGAVLNVVNPGRGNRNR